MDFGALTMDFSALTTYLVGRRWPLRHPVPRAASGEDRGPGTVKIREIRGVRAPKRQKESCG